MSEKQKHYKETKTRPNFPEIEHEVLKFWADNNIFKKSVEEREGNEEFVFYDGPPFANGLPHYGHILTSYAKDTIPRFQTQLGKKVERRWGWDCHGLPAELGTAKTIGISSRNEIEEYGIEKFNNVCKTDVLKYAKEWREIVDRMGRWVDFDNDYKTMDMSYTESIIWIFKTLYEKGLIYEDYKVMAYSWAAETTVSKFETAMDNSYQDRTDPALTVAFKIKNTDEDIYFLAWTTTPWTLPSNLALAVGADVTYVCVKKDGKKYILAKSALEKYKKELEGYEIVESNLGKKEHLGKELKGMEYEPLFPYYKEKSEDGCFRVFNADFVTTDDGTGIVHLAPYGEDDFNLFKENNIKIVTPVDDKGNFTEEITDYKGMNVFAANEKIYQDLKAAGKILRKENYVHSYPHCWRTDEPLIYKPVSSWFVKITDELKDKMLKSNEQINWIPDHIKHGLMENGIKTSPDWPISRSRFWGAPIPVWKSDNSDFPRVDVMGSIEEIEKVSGQKVTDFHKPYIDNITYPNPDDPSGKTMMVRVPDVLDCWFESGSMPVASVHYPFENKDWFEKHFPADFIVEYTPQVRGWFSRLLVISAALFDKPAFTNAICHGTILDEKNQKLSKRLRNYPDPNEVLETLGSDALRWFLFNTPVLTGGTLSIDLEGKGIAQALRRSVIPLYNAYHFFTLYANADGIKAEENFNSDNILDKYILSKLKILSENVKNAMEKFEVALAGKNIEGFLETLNNWYIRRSRGRFWGTDISKEEEQKAFNTLYTVLVNVTKISASMLPFITEHIYKNLTGRESIHLDLYPKIKYSADETLVKNMDLVQDVCATVKALRDENGIKIRQPLSKITISRYGNLLKDYADIIKDEVNIKEVEFVESFEDKVNKFLYVYTPIVGKRLGAALKEISKNAKSGNYEIKKGKAYIGEYILEANEFEERIEFTDQTIAGKAIPDNTAVVVLDTNITETLQLEGFARDIVRGIQDLRKEKDFNVSDRINLYYNTNNEEIKKAVNSFENYIKEQTLTQNLELSENTENIININDFELKVRIEKE